jgi:hypothetical protein
VDLVTLRKGPRGDGLQVPHHRSALARCSRLVDQGEAALGTYLFTLPIALALVVLLTPFTFLPILTARRIKVESGGLSIVRFRKAEDFAWVNVKVGY